VPIIGFGLYPKLLTQVYDSTTLQLTDHLREKVFAMNDTESGQPLAWLPLKAPALPKG
jgi:NAD(P)H-quinone oxidoreductase subunit 4